jgi:hypothetical protein
VLGFEIGGLDPDQSRITLSSMPKGPRGQKAPADVIGAAIMTARIATGEIEEMLPTAPKRAIGGKAGGKARAERLSPEQRQAIARKGAQARWSRRK